MSSFLKMSESLSLAFHAMVCIAEEPDEFSHVKKVAKKIDGSEHHLARVVIQLSRNGLIETRRGPKGGIRLLGEPGEITLMDIYESVEGKIVHRDCIMGRRSCRNKSCIFGDLHKRVWRDISRYLYTTTLEHVIEDRSSEDEKETGE